MHSLSNHACDISWTKILLFCHFPICPYSLSCIYIYIISYPLFADADTGIYPHAASQYHTRPKDKHGIAMLSVDKFQYLRKQTRCNEFIPCSNDVCQILKRFRSFRISDTPFSGLNNRINTVLLDRIAVVRKADGGRDRHCDVINDVPFSLFFTLMTSNVRYVYIYFTVVSQSEARVSTEHGINIYIVI